MNCSGLNFKSAKTAVKMDWFCAPCLSSIFPFNHFDNDEEFLLDLRESNSGFTFNIDPFIDLIFNPISETLTNINNLDRDHAIQSGNIVSESDESSNDNDIRKSPFDVPGQFLITRRRDALHRKATRDAKRKIAEQRFLKQRKSKKVAKILQDCPDIGKTIEDFV